MPDIKFGFFPMAILVIIGFYLGVITTKRIEAGLLENSSFAMGSKPPVVVKVFRSLTETSFYWFDSLEIYHPKFIVSIRDSGKVIDTKFLKEF